MSKYAAGDACPDCGTPMEFEPGESWRYDHLGSPDIMNIWIPGNVPSLKNSRATSRKTGASYHSPQVKDYLRSLGIQDYSLRKKTVKGYVDPKVINIFSFCMIGAREHLEQYISPWVIGLYFVRGSRHKFDFLNAAHIIFDLMTAHGIIPDDNMDIVIPTPVPFSRISCMEGLNNQWYHYDKSSPGVWVVL